MNRVGNNLCSFNAKRGDICHLYLNPDKIRLQDMWVTVHLMERGIKQLDTAPNYQDVTISYWNETAK
jgi:hypothetical protein